jgi:hypothetical protein
VHCYKISQVCCHSQACHSRSPARSKCNNYKEKIGAWREDPGASSNSCSCRSQVQWLPLPISRTTYLNHHKMTHLCHRKFPFNESRVLTSPNLTSHRPKACNFPLFIFSSCPALILLLALQVPISADAFLLILFFVSYGVIVLKFTTTWFPFRSATILWEFADINIFYCSLAPGRRVFRTSTSAP